MRAVSKSRSIALSWIRAGWSRPFVRFLVTGGLNTLFGYAVYASAILLGLDFRAALFVGMFLGALFNFKSYGALTFRQMDNRRLGRFVVVYAVIYAVNSWGLMCLDEAGVPPLLGQALIILPVAIASYILLKRFVYVRKDGDRA